MFPVGSANSPRQRLSLCGGSEPFFQKQAGNKRLCQPRDSVLAEALPSCSAWGLCRLRPCFLLTATGISSLPSAALFPCIPLVPARFRVFVSFQR